MPLHGSSNHLLVLILSHANQQERRIQGHNKHTHSPTATVITSGSMLCHGLSNDEKIQPSRKVASLG